MTERKKELTSGVRTRHRTNVRAMFSSSFLKQVRRTRDLVYPLLYISILIGVASGLPSRPRIIQTGNQTVVIFRNQPCRPVDPQHLSLKMGQYFDKSRMALDEDTVKRSVLQQDETNVDNDYPDDKSDDSDAYEDDDDSVDETSDIHPFTDNPLNPNYLKSQKFMRRRRDVDLEEDDIDNERNDEDDKSQYQRLMESKTMNKQLKRFVKKSKKLKKVKKLPWTCKMKQVWLQMEEGYFPPYVRSAECRSRKCFFNIYECIPKKYTIKILRRDPNRCNPVPSYGVNTTYEEMWIFERYHVTVWCECGNSRKGRRRGRLRKGRTKNRSRP